MTGIHDQMDQNQVHRVIRIGADVGKCTLYVEYANSMKQTRTKRIHLKKSRCNSADQLCNELICHFPEYLNEDAIPRNKVVKCLLPL